MLRMKQTALLVRVERWGEVISTCMKGMQSTESPDQSSSRQFGRKPNSCLMMGACLNYPGSNVVGEYDMTHHWVTLSVYSMRLNVVHPNDILIKCSASYVRAACPLHTHQPTNAHAPIRMSFMRGTGMYMIKPTLGDSRSGQCGVPVLGCTSGLLTIFVGRAGAQLGVPNSCNTVDVCCIWMC